MPSNSEARMLERRISNNRSDLDGDQKINYFLSWFQQWSDLQKSDFVPVLAERMSSSANGGYHDASDSMGSLSLGSGSRKPPSLFDCQVKLFRDWFLGWSDDQKNYLVMRLRDIDSNFFSKFEHRMSSGGQTPPEKDYFEPGVPDDLVRPSSHSEQDSGIFNSSVHAKLVEVSEDEENEEKAGSCCGDDDDVKDDGDVDDDQGQPVVVEDDDDDPYLRKNASINSCDNGIGLDAGLEDSCLNEESS